MTATRLVTFDVYMALLDIQGSLVPRMQAMTGADAEMAAKMVNTWRAKQMERAASSNSLGGTRTSFRRCTSLALDYVCDRFDVSLSATDREVLVGEWDRLRPWPEAEDAIRAVREKGIAIGILSNGDQSMLDAVASRFRTAFDHVLSSETAGWYKPHPAVYALPEVQLGISCDETLHVAGSANDVLGAVSFGMRCAWSNRHGDALVDPDFPPTREFPDLLGVVEML